MVLFRRFSSEQSRLVKNKPCLKWLIYAEYLNRLTRIHGKAWNHKLGDFSQGLSYHWFIKNHIGTVTTKKPLKSGQFFFHKSGFDRLSLKFFVTVSFYITKTVTRVRFDYKYHKLWPFCDFVKSGDNEDG
jgi:hypothetical protein